MSDESMPCVRCHEETPDDEGESSVCGRWFCSDCYEKHMTSGCSECSAPPEEDG